MIFDFVFRLSISWYSWVFLPVASLHWIFGVHYLYKKWFKYDSEEGSKKTWPYDSYRSSFLTEYDRCNPLTINKASQNYSNFLKGNLLYSSHFLTKSRSNCPSPN